MNPAQFWFQSGGYQISRSLRFNSADSAYLNRTPASAGNRRTFTWSSWVKRGALSSYQNFIRAGGTLFRFSNSDTLNYEDGLGGNLSTTAVFRDPSAWYHVVLSVDTTQATGSNRLKIYVNGIEQALSGTNPSQNSDTSINNTTAHFIGQNTAGAEYLSAYLTEINFIDGQALTPSSFGETDTITGVWKPKKYAGTYGTNGFYLNFSDNSGTTSTTLGKDSSGNSNNWTPNNFSVTAGAGNDSMIDTPTPYADGGNGRGNYCTLNPLARYTEYGSLTTTNGNLATSGGGTDFAQVLGSMGVRSGKWYFEGTLTTAYGVGASQIGIAPATFKLSGYASNNGPSITAASANGASYDGRGFLYLISSGPVFGATYTTGDVIGVAFDADTGKVWFAKNNTWQASGNPASGTSPATTLTTGDTWVPIFGGYQSGVWDANFGQRPFAYTPPSGFVALNTQNLPEPSIKKPGSYFNTVLYTGNVTTRSITGVGFQPDFVWLKRRSTAAVHGLWDAVRGASKYLVSNNTDAEQTDTTNGVQGFLSDGFDLGATATWNGNNETYVAWCWDESATPGFDIVTYTGNGTARTIAHSLGVAPSWMVVKRRDAAEDWGVYHVSMGNGNYMYLNGTQGSTSGSVWNNTTPTSSVFSVGTSTVVNANTGTYVAYLWSEVAGFSKFGSYTGNGSSQFVYLGFRPRWLLIKNTGQANDWFLLDSARSTYNEANVYLHPNSSSAEVTYGWIDFLSNGFKVNNTGTGNNNNGINYIFAAFAEAPFKYALAR